MFDGPPTDTTLSLRAGVNTNGATYVAYLFAHNAGGFGLTGTDNVISCGSYTGNGSTNGPTIDLGYEPQWLMIKRATGGTANWGMFDNMRGVPTGGADFELRANTSEADTDGAGQQLDFTATGFTIRQTYSGINTNGSTYIYIAIRRGPMRTPTSGTSVFFPQTGNSIGVANLTGVGFAPDTILSRSRQGGVNYHAFTDKLRGTGTILTSGSTDAEVSGLTGVTGWLNDGAALGVDSSQFYINSASYNPWSRLFFRRAPGFFDVVCYTGNGSIQTVNHNLGVQPELVIVKPRQNVSASTGSYGNANDWWVWAKTLSDTIGANTMLQLNTSNAVYNAGGSIGPITNVTSTTFRVIFDFFGPPQVTAASGVGYVAYLFASCPGVSRVGSYTGNGSSQTINCGFTGGARFVMVKRTDSTGNWMVVDTARGLVAAGDPTLYLNSTAAEVTGVDWLDPDSSGFIVNQEGTMNANVNGGTYIYLAIA